MLRRVSSYKASISIAGAIIPAIAGSFLFFLLLKPDNGLDALITCRTENKVPLNCFSNVINKVAEQRGFAEAFALIQSAKETIPELHFNCHSPVAHRLGELAYQKTGDIVGSFLLVEDPSFCTGGFQHGVIMGFMSVQRSSDPDLVREKTCDSLANHVQNSADKKRQLWQCYHGLGHGFMMQSFHDLSESLASCDAASQETPYQKACYYGAYMENSFNGIASHSGNHRTKAEFFAVGDLFFPCKKIPEKYRPTCYLGTTIQHLFETKGDYSEFLREFRKSPFKSCVEVPPIYKPYCARGLGTVLGYALKWDADQIIIHCMMGNDTERRSCLKGAAGHETIFPHDTVSGVSLCEKINFQYRTECLAATREVFLE